MAIRLRSTLKQWFKRGRYPVESQFADWMDSYVHRTEDTIPISQVEGLAGQLNAKYDNASGLSLEKRLATLQTGLTQHTSVSDQKFNRVTEDIVALQANDYRSVVAVDRIVLDTDVTVSVEMGTTSLGGVVEYYAAGGFVLLASDGKRYSYWSGRDYLYNDDRQIRSDVLLLNGNRLWEWTGTTYVPLYQDARYEVFDSMFASLAGASGSIDHTHMEDGKPAPYCLNGLWLTYEEAMLVVATYTTDAHLHETYSHVPVRTVIPLSAIWDGQLHRTFELNKTVEVVVFNDFRAEAVKIPFYGCSKLRKVTGLRQTGSFGWADAFTGCAELEILEIDGLRGDIDLRDSPLLSVNSLLYLATKSDRTIDKTIIVNRDAYDRWQTEVDWDNMLFPIVSSKVTIATA